VPLSPTKLLKDGLHTQKKATAISALAEGVCATVLMVALITAIFLFRSNSLGRAPSGDVVNQAEQKQRLTEFMALSPLPLLTVKDNEVTQAIEAMNLSTEQQQKLREDLTPRSVQKSMTETNRNVKNQALALAWITLWDTDAEDGDVVRIESQGYSRTVVLTKKLQTFAIPIPSNGVINIIGVQDGEGGGITVGLASGATQAVFPIMSVGQILSLKVGIN